MYYELYIDLFFLENLLLDFLLLFLTGIIGKLRLDFRKMALSAFLGAVGACLFVIIPVTNRTMLLAGQVGISVLMVKWGFGLQKRRLRKSVVLFYGLAFLWGGVLEALHSALTIPVLLSGILGSCLLFLVLLLKERWKEQTRDIYEVTLVWNGRQKELRGLRDTGNRLKDPYLGKPVTVVEYNAVKELFNQKTKVLWIPYHSIGKENGWMPGIQLDYFLLRTETEQKKIEAPIVAISKETVSARGSYQMILPSALTDD